ncbi:poliovirus receptor-like isoform X2 [Colossoma macropomum]|uniref:poliovirus receptor-like isoform X2 n=1 Tax=Colossoma macropomum TaxID=42526 RepID=UPI0018650263|nr:poliovirus receptor-like isoform X2 [Colossoma macropomum]
MFSQSSANITAALILILLAGSLAQRVKVQPEVVSYPGQVVSLRCQFPDPGQTQLTQVSWIFETAAGVRTSIAVFHPNFGINYSKSPVTGRVSFTIDPPQLENPTIQITDMKLTDEGKYICEYATYPSGNEQGVTNLVILAKPSNTASTVTVQAGTAPVIVARCESVNGRPPATISWVTSVGGNGTTPTEMDNLDNTVTVKSEYWLVPTPADNGRDISCEVSHRTLTSPETFPMKLVIEYPPQVQIVGYDSNWYLGRTNAVLTCQAQGNPPPTITWRTTSGLMPETVQVKENKLTVLKVDETVSTTFICEVRNGVSTGTDQVTVMVRGLHFHTDTDNRTLVYAASGVVVVLILMFIAVFLWIRRRAAVTSREREESSGEAPKSGDDTYSALNPNTTSSDYDTLTHVRDSPSDTYSALNPKSMSSDYDTLTPVRDSPSDTYSALNPETRTSDYDTLTVVRPHPVMRRAPENEN